MPFKLGLDTAVYLVEIATLYTLMTAGIVLAILGIDPASWIILCLAAVSMTVLSRRARLLKETSARIAKRHERALQVDVLSLRFVRAALRDRNLPPALASLGIIAAAVLVVVATIMNRDQYF